MTILPPIPRPADPEHDAWVREHWAQWGYPGEPSPCDCGYFEGDGLVTCEARSRVYHCRPNAQMRLANYYRVQQKREVRRRREFPGAPFEKADCGTCKWCGDPIVLGRVKARSWHDGRGPEPDCKHEYMLHTRAEVQLNFLLNRDGICCKRCGLPSGGWRGQRHGVPTDPEELRARGGKWADWYSAKTYTGIFSRVEWRSTLEVDHVRALYLVHHLPPEERRPWFGPTNLQGLCPGCHAAKTREDMKLIAAARRATAEGDQR